MKKLFLMSMLLMSYFAKAQNDSPCNKIEFNNDEVRNYKSYTTPIDINSSDMVYINKIIEPNKKPVYYLYFRVNESTGKTVNGLYIILKNGKRISRPNEEIDLEVDNEEVSIEHPGFKQSVMIELSQSELLTLKSSPIEKYAISYLTESIYDANDLYSMFLCLLDKK